MFALVVVLVVAGCAPSAWSPSAMWSTSVPACVEATSAILLPRSVPESSGVVEAGDGSGDLWTHNDSWGEPVLYRVDRSGREVARVRVRDAVNRDWEDLAAGPCVADGAGGAPARPRCLYIADTGDNREVRDDAAIYRVPEPAPGDTVTAPADRFPVVFPEGPRDVEALYVLPGERLFLIGKGRNHPVELFAAPAPLGEPGRVLVLERIQFLTARSPWLPRHVSGADATPDGSLVVVRTYETLAFHRPRADGRLDPIDVGPINLRPLREPQGEGVAFLSSWPRDGGLVLTSERGPGGVPGAMWFLRCRVAEDEPPPSPPVERDLRTHDRRHIERVGR